MKGGSWGRFGGGGGGGGGQQKLFHEHRLYCTVLRPVRFIETGQKSVYSKIDVKQSVA